MKRPTYRHWKTRNQGFAEHNGHRVYFPGPYGSAESREAYRRWLERIEVITSPGRLTVAIFGELYLEHCAKFYGAGARTASGAAGLAVREVIHGRWGGLPVGQFGPRALAEFQSHLAAEGLARTTVNARVAWVRRWFKWGVAQELVRPEALLALQAVPGLRRGRSGAREPRKRPGVGWDDVRPVLDELSPNLRPALMLQWLTGARSGSIVSARGDQFVPDPQNADILLWFPRHKTEYRGATLVIPLGPRAQDVLNPVLKAAGNGPLFSPRATRHNGRAGATYSAWSYRRAIVRAQDRAIKKCTMVSHWTPHQLRHARGQFIRDKYGLEAAQAALGHESIAATQIYSSARLDLARKIALAEG